MVAILTNSICKSGLVRHRRKVETLALPISVAATSGKRRRETSVSQIMLCPHGPKTFGTVKGAATPLQLKVGTTAETSFIYD